MNARIFIWAPQRRQVRGSTSYTLLMSRAQLGGQRLFLLFALRCRQFPLNSRTAGSSSQPVEAWVSTISRSEGHRFGCRVIIGAGPMTAYKALGHSIPRNL